ncbi:MAG: hypothetical protein ACP5E4_03290 [Candidatus Aenigmatarchaeota archaeon]
MSGTEGAAVYPLDWHMEDWLRQLFFDEELKARYDESCRKLEQLMAEGVFRDDFFDLVHVRHLQRHPDQISPSPADGLRNYNLHLLRRVLTQDLDPKSAWGCDRGVKGCRIYVSGLGEKNDLITDTNCKLISFSSPVYMGFDSPDLKEPYEFVIGKPSELKTSIPGFSVQQRANTENDSAELFQEGLSGYLCPNTGEECELVKAICLALNGSDIKAYHLNHPIDYAAVAIWNRLNLIYTDKAVQDLMELSEEILALDSEVEDRVAEYTAKAANEGYI